VGVDVSCYDMFVMSLGEGYEAGVRIRALAEFRFTLRRFLHFSEEAAGRVGLAPKQHQLLLQVAGAPAGTAVSVGYLAERLVLRHHSVVELINRCVSAGLVTRRRDDANRRVVVLALTAGGDQILRELSADHARELNEFGPELIEALQKVMAAAAGGGDWFDGVSE